MYFGSVRFFKHLIVGMVILMILVPTVLSLHFGMSYYHLSAEVDKQAVQAKQQDKEESEEGGPFTVYAEDGREPEEATSPLSYQLSYPDLYIKNDFSFQPVKDKMVYLTFDDGPTSLTPAVLDVLKKYQVKATFFIVYHEDEASKAIYKRMLAEGHTIGVHSTSHKYKEIYRSVDAFLTDFEKTAKMLEAVTGVKPEIFRFPGGSISGYNAAIYQPLIAEMLRRGYTYYDWNVGSEDTSSQKTIDSIYNNVVKGVRGHEHSVALMHDAASHDSTLKALPRIIETLQGEGYTFAALDKTVQPVMFGYVD